MGAVDLTWITINRRAAEGRQPLSKVIKGLEDSPALKRIFPKKADRDKVGEVVVEVATGPGYAYIDDTDGTLVLSQDYLHTGEKFSLYLDFLHELTHVRQYREGKELYDKRFKYVDRPTEVEAYQVAVEEARRLEMDDAQILEYLAVEWVTQRDLARLAKACGVPSKKRG